MAVTANQLLTHADNERIGGRAAASTTLYQGTLAYINATGYIDDDTASGVNLFAGIVVTNVDNSAGAAGDKPVTLYNRGVFTLVGSGFTQADVGKKVYASDNYTISLSASGNVLIGRCTEYVSATQLKVEIVGRATNPEHSQVAAKTSGYTVLAAESGKTFTTVGAGGAVTFAMPAAVVGLKYRFRVGAAQELRIDPDGTETIALPSTGVQGAAGKYLTANADGETVDIECTKAGQWSVFGFTGTWTAEA